MKRPKSAPKCSSPFRMRAPASPPRNCPASSIPFYRTESAASPGENGLSLGLSVCKRLVERAHGFMYATLRPGGGMEFGFRLRVATTGEGTEPKEEG